MLANNWQTKELLDETTVPRKEVFKALSILNLDKSPGPDNVHPKVLIEAKKILPIFKNGNKNIPANYCPASLASIANYVKS